MKNQKEKLTCQKKAILDFLTTVKTHPTAKEIYQSVKNQLPQISKGTVYRNLELFAQKGVILSLFSRTTHYDGKNFPHSHFLCQKCDRIFDCKFDHENKLLNPSLIKKAKIKWGKIKGYYLIFYGLCENCQKKNKKTRN
jgi:Fe2+ or Zn2+ uptake regulation protein